MANRSQDQRILARTAQGAPELGLRKAAGRAAAPTPTLVSARKINRSTDSRNPDIPSLEIVRFFLSNGVPGNSIAYPELRSGKTGLGLVECIAESSYGLRPVR